MLGARLLALAVLAQPDWLRYLPDEVRANMWQRMPADVRARVFQVRDDEREGAASPNGWQQWRRSGDFSARWLEWSTHAHGRRGHDHDHDHDHDSTDHAGSHGHHGGAAAGARNGAASVASTAGDWQQYVPSTSSSGADDGSSGGGKARTAQPAAPAQPVGAAPAATALLPQEVLVTGWHGTNFTLRYETAEQLDGGFVGVVHVEPWVPGAVFSLNYTGTDVAIERLWGADAIFGSGVQLTAFELITGKGEAGGAREYLVRLHEGPLGAGGGAGDVQPGRLARPLSAPSGSGAFRWVARGRAQPPVLTTGYGALLDDAQPAARGGAQRADAADGRVLQYASYAAWPGGFLGNVQVSPWNVGDVFELDFGHSHAYILQLWNADVVGSSGQKYIVRLNEHSERAWHSGLASPRASVGFIAVGSPAKPTLRNLGADEERSLVSVPLLRAAPQHEGGSWAASESLVGFVCGALFTALAAMAARHSTFRARTPSRASGTPSSRAASSSRGSSWHRAPVGAPGSALHESILSTAAEEEEEPWVVSQSFRMSL